MLGSAQSHRESEQLRECEKHISLACFDRRVSITLPSLTAPHIFSPLRRQKQEQRVSSEGRKSQALKAAYTPGSGIGWVCVPAVGVYEFELHHLLADLKETTYHFFMSPSSFL